MKEIALNILDICNNSLAAGASVTELIIDEVTRKEYITITIRDNGKGMTPVTLSRVTDPFFTTGTTKKTGMGIPLIREHALITGGDFYIDSEEGKGTVLKAGFKKESIDRQPMGDLPGVIAMVATASEKMDLVMEYISPKGRWKLDTKQIKQELGIERLDDVTIKKSIREMINNNITELEPTN